LSIGSALLKEEPFINYAKYINLHYVNSPITLEDFGVEVSADGLLTCDKQMLSEQCQSAPEDDVVMLLTNIPNVRSSAWDKTITLGASSRVERVFIHEMGHAFGDLADEYEDPLLALSRPIARAEFSPNTTLIPLAKACKWHYWMVKSYCGAHMKLLLPKGRKIEHSEGGYYHRHGVYRPENQCLMRSTSGKTGYCLVCAEHLERQFFTHLDPIDEVSPVDTDIALWSDEEQHFHGDIISVKASGGKVGKFVPRWMVNGKAVRGKHRAKASAFVFKAKDHGPGLHEVSLRVDFVNGNVRRDLGWLSSSKTWRVEVSALKKPRLKLSNLRCRSGQTVRVSAIESSTEHQVQWRGLPKGAVVSGNDVHWEVPQGVFGSWQVQAVVEDGAHSASASCYWNCPRKLNKKLELRWPKAFKMERDRPWEWFLGPESGDPDGDHLSLEVLKGPSGMEKVEHPMGLRWCPTSEQGPIGLHVVIHDGSARLSLKSSLLIGGDYAPLSAHTRSRSPSQRAQAIISMDAFPVSHVILECSRLLRDEYSKVAKMALGKLKATLKEQPDFVPMFMAEVSPHLWSYSDRPFVLEYIKTHMEGQKKYSRERITLSQVERYGPRWDR
jgi:hypothetical protein